MAHTQSEINRARACLVAAALLWSVGGLFTRLLQKETILGLHEPALSSLQIAFYRAFFAGLVFLPLLRRRDLTWRPVMLLMVAFFTAMNALFVSAMVLGPAANAILLQNTAPFWLYLVCVYILGERHDRRTFQSLLIAMTGVGVIVVHGMMGQRLGGDQLTITAMAICSSMMYAGVILCLRELKSHSSMWLTTQNHLGTAICLSAAILVINGPVFWWSWTTAPSARQILFLAIFGAMQMALPYALFARGLKHVTPQEAGMIVLVEPLLNPLWTWLISPETDTPSTATWIGGALILGALFWRYMPRRSPESIL
jgi:drug/metabolite transporter, DME family